MFGKELIEQVEADSKGEERQVPVIVEKCIDAVEARGTSLTYYLEGHSHHLVTSFGI